jgi:hypothetical protein
MPWVVLQAERVHVGDEHQQAGERLLLGDAELGRLLDRVGGVGAGVGQADDLGARGLGLEQEGREVGAGKGWRTEPSTLPPLALTTADESFSSAWPKA